MTGRAVIAEFTGAHKFLSNFHRAPIAMDDGLIYPTAEHAFQAQKTGDMRERMRIQTLRTPAEAKAAGRQVVLVDGWDGVRKRVMFDVVLAKFWQNDSLAGWLAATEDADLVEGNYWHDNFWGHCGCRRLPRCETPGLNYLGQILMWVRAVLRED